MERSTLSVLDVYGMTMKQANFWKEQAATDRPDASTCAALSQELYAVCANLERTKEVNP